MAQIVNCTQLVDTDIDVCPPYASRSDVVTQFNEICNKLGSFYSVSSGVLPEDFLETNFASTANIPDELDVPILFVLEGCNIWAAKNDYINCDLGTIPATPGTGTDWALLASKENDQYELNKVSDYTTNSASFVNIDATNLSLDINVKGGTVLIGFDSVVTHDTNGAYIYLELTINSVAHAGDDGMTFTKVTTAGDVRNLSFTRLLTGLAAGVYNFKIQWKTSAGNATMYAGAGTANSDVHTQFWVKEI